MAYLSLNLYDTPGLAPRMNVLFLGPGDFPVSYSNRYTSWNAWNRHSGSFMVDTGILLVPYRWNRGDYRCPCRLTLCPYVCPSVCPSVRQSVSPLGVRPTRFSELFSVVLSDIDLKFGIWIYLNIIQIKFDCGCVWPTFTWVIALAKLFVFPDFSLSSFDILSWNFIYKFALT